MKVIIKQTKIIKNLEKVSKALDPNAPLHALKGILFKVTEEGIQFTASDSILTVRHFMPVEANVQVVRPGKALIPGRLLINMLKKLNGTIKLDVSDDTLVVSTEEVTYKMNTLDINDFPNIDLTNSERKIKISGKILNDIEKEVAFAVGQNDKRIILNGLNININNKKMIVTATNSYRLAKKTIEVETDLIANVTILPKNLKQFIPEDLNKEIDLFIDDSKISVKNENTIIQSRLIDGIYPDTTKLIPEGFDSLMEVDSKKMINALDTVTVMSTGVSAPIRFEANENGAMIESKRDEIGNSKIIFKEMKWSGKAMEISFDSKYVRDAISKPFSGDVQIKFVGQLQPIIITSESNRSVIQLVLPFRTY
ncbi:MAG: DNA polymerase III subunit beta [Mycoplasma sp.]|nr:DNA polymerase III subunit beta [Mycoplasma sp.]